MTTSTVEGTPARRPPRRRVRPTALTWFLCLIVVVLAVYTQIALGMEWRTEAGRIGAGFFPRVIGTLGIVLCCVAGVRSVRAAEPDERAAATPRHDRHPRLLAVAVAAAAALLVLLVPLGAVLTSALFIFGFMRLLGRGRPVLDLVLSVSVSLFLYLLLEVWLRAGLPDGVLPLP